MKLVMACVGRTRSREMVSAAGEYLKRLRKYAAVRTVEIREERGREAAARRREGERAAALLREGDYLVLCDERGEEMSSRGLADFLAERERSGRGRTVFLVGGPFGVDVALRERADLALSMSRMTLPHELARLLLVEQIYRAFTILRGEQYHHG